MDRSKQELFIKAALISSQDVCNNLGVTRARLMKIKELKAVIRGYYLVEDINNYVNDAAIQERRMKWGKNA